MGSLAPIRNGSDVVQQPARACGGDGTTNRRVFQTLLRVFCHVVVRWGHDIRSCQPAGRDRGGAAVGRSDLTAPQETGGVLVA